MLVLFQDALLGGRIVSVGEHALVVQLRELVQLRYPRRGVIRGRSRGRGGSGWVEPDLLPFPWSPAQDSRAS